MAKSGPNKDKKDKKVANSLVAVSCAAVLAVYSAGYSRTRAAASQFEAQSAERRPAPPDQTRVAASNVDAPVAEPALRSAVPVSGSRTTIPQAEAVPSVVEAPAATATITPVETPVAAPAAPVAVVVAPVAPAPAPQPPPPPPPAPPAPKWRDGTFTGWGSSRHGDIQAAVVIEDGRIQGATIAQCLTRYSCNVIEMLPPQVAARQSADVDYVSRATESANAFYYAVVDALSKATPKP